MRNIIRFYEGKEENGLKLENILNYSDYEIQTNPKIFDLLYPSKLNRNINIAFDDNKETQQKKLLRANGFKAVLRMFDFFGYKVIETKEGTDIIQSKNLNRLEKGIIVGLFNTDNFPIITRIIKFLKFINMPVFSTLFFLMIVRSIQNDPAFKFLINKRGQSHLADWIETQDFLKDIQAEVYKKLLTDEEPEMEEWEKAVLQLEFINEQPKKPRDAWGFKFSRRNKCQNKIVKKPKKK